MPRNRSNKNNKSKREKKPRQQTARGRRSTGMDPDINESVGMQGRGDPNRVGGWSRRTEPGLDADDTAESGGQPSRAKTREEREDDDINRLYL